MVKRVTKARLKLLMWAIIIGLPIYGLFQLVEFIGWAGLIAGVIIIVAVVFGFKALYKKIHRQRLIDKYQDSGLVNDLMKGIFWQGQSAEQLFDSLGEPEDIDTKVLKTKKKEIWKYDHEGGNRYGLRITLDDDVVVGWDQKT
ncbi:MAG: DUF2845 domain-containing protein [Endozoicomonadaceae bacterium]|nr:DUF2845 domain-containing protein [Endozoicomonadaceae bacterium]